VFSVTPGYWFGFVLTLCVFAYSKSLRTLSPVMTPGYGSNQLEPEILYKGSHTGTISRIPIVSEIKTFVRQGQKWEVKWGPPAFIALLSRAQAPLRELRHLDGRAPKSGTGRSGASMLSYHPAVVASRRTQA
jgi:hypothetical protein